MTKAGTEIGLWLLEQGMAGASRSDLLQGYCDRLTEAGLELMRVHVAQSAYHPRYGAFGYSWRRNTDVLREDYEVRDGDSDQWLSSPLYYLLKNGLPELCVQICEIDGSTGFPLIDDLRTEGATDYMAVAVGFGPHRFEKPDVETTTEGVLLSWTCDRPNGFTEAQRDLIRTTVPYLGMTLKSSANWRMAQDLLGVYLGRDAGRRVLSGEYMRGSSERLDAVICFLDLEGFTSLSQQLSGEEVIDMLNAYFGVAVEAIQAEGGNVLKYMGDGLLAIFDRARIEDASDAALRAARQIRRGMAGVSTDRSAAGDRTTGYTVALHAGEVLYGNMGAEERLDFTVIGPAVNLTARLSAMHRSLGQTLILSQDVADSADRATFDLVSLGRYMLRGVDTPQELFTLYDPQFD